MPSKAQQRSPATRKAKSKSTLLFFLDDAAKMMACSHVQFATELSGAGGVLFLSLVVHHVVHLRETLINF